MRVDSRDSNEYFIRRDGDPCQFCRVYGWDNYGTKKDWLSGVVGGPVSTSNRDAPLPELRGVLDVHTWLGATVCLDAPRKWNKLCHHLSDPQTPDLLYASGKVFSFHKKHQSASPLHDEIRASANQTNEKLLR